MAEEKKYSKRSQRLFAAMTGRVLAHPVKVVVAALLLTVLSVIVIATKFDIRSDLKDLMPQDAQVVTDMYAISDRMGSITTLKVYLKIPELVALSPERRASEEYRSCLEAFGGQDKLLREPPIVGETWCDNALMLFARRFVESVRGLDSVGNVGFVNDKSFFEDHLLLYASVEEIDAAYAKIDEVLTEARRQSGEYKACLLTSSEESECESLRPSMGKSSGASEGSGDDFVSDLKRRLYERYQTTELANISEFPFYSIPNGWMVALEVRLKDSSTGLKSISAEVKRIDALLAQIDMAQYDSRIVVEYGGGFNDMKEEYNAIVVDIARSISVTILSIILLIALFFRSLRAACRVFGPLVMSTLWALGITFLAIGYLNLITAFIFAVLIGLGIDFGIHLYSRYLVERRLGHSVEESLKIAVIETGSPLFFGAMTTAAAFFALMLGSFPGFSQFGFVAGIGVLIAFMAMTTVMPALTLVMERLKPSKVREVSRRPGVSREKTRAVAPWCIGIGVVLLCGAGYCASILPDIQFEENFYNLRLKETPESNSTAQVKTEKYVTTKRPSSPVVAIMENTEQVQVLSQLLLRDREYTEFQRYRRVFSWMPQTMMRLESIFSESWHYFGQSRSFPIYAAFVRTLPYDPNYNVSGFLPLFANYGARKSASLRLYRQLGLTMPNTLEYLSTLAPEVYASNTEANALVEVSAQVGLLPGWLREAIPTQRMSQQKNTISDFASIFSYLPGTDSQQEARLASIRRISERVADRQIRFLPESEKAQIRDFRKYLVTEPIGLDDLPEWVKLQFKESGNHPLPPRPESGVDYAFGNIAVMYQATSTYNGRQAAMLARDARSIRVEDKPLIAATGAFVYADMLELVKTDGLQIAFVALGVILLLAFIQQRHFVPALVVTLPVISGLIITIGIMVLFDFKLGLFNIVMLPVTLGIGIDGSIYLFQRYHSLGRGSVFQAVRVVLPPVFMSSATTMVGFGGMIMSQHMGLNSMGVLAIIGIGCCFLSTFLLQPGLILMVEKLPVKRGMPDGVYDPDKEE